MATMSSNSSPVIIIVVLALIAGVAYFIWKDQQTDTVSLNLPGGKSASISVEK